MYLDNFRSGLGIKFRSFKWRVDLTGGVLATLHTYWYYGGKIDTIGKFYQIDLFLFADILYSPLVGW